MLLALLLKLLAPLVESVKKHRRTQFAALPLRDVDVLFVGDSITEGGIWDEWFPHLTTANRGIAGETSGEVLGRMDTLAASARIVLLLIGTNDLSLRVPEADIAANVARIVDGLHARFPEARIIVHSVMPRKTSRQASIASLNLSFERVAKGAGATYLDLWPALSGIDGAIRPELSLDHLHLNGEGYRRWVGHLRPVIDDVLSIERTREPSP